MKKKTVAALFAGLMAAALPMASYAGVWMEDENGWRYFDDDGTYLTDCWRWIDGDSDGTAECYYFGKYGYTLSSVMTPDGYTVNADGAWTMGGKVQTVAAEEIMDNSAAEESPENEDSADAEAEAPASGSGTYAAEGVDGGNEASAVSGSSSGWGASDGIDVQLFADGMYVLDAMHTKAYLITGEDRALLIDTLLESDNVRAEAEKLTDLPIEVLITHGHPDHIGGVTYFDSCYIGEADAYLLPEGIEARYIAEGDVISCGDYDFEVIEIPGHTYGSVALLDRGHRILITGDSVYEGPIIMYGDGVDMEAYAQSMLKLMAYADDADYVFAGHNRQPVGTEYIQYAYEDALAYLAGELEGTPRQLAGSSGNVYQGGHVAFYAE